MEPTNEIHSFLSADQEHLLTHRTGAMLFLLLVLSIAFAFAVPDLAHASEPGTYDINNDNVTCTSSDGTYVITGSSTKHYVAVSGGTEASPITLTLNGASINLRHSDNDDSIERSAIQIDSGSWVVINVEGDNYLQGGNDTGLGDNDGYAAIGVHSGAHLTIEGNGTLEARGGGNSKLEQGAAGVGGDRNGASHGDRNAGAITIRGNVTLSAYGAYHAAGIGGGSDANEANGVISITGTPHINAYGGQGGAGIGSGDDGNGGSVSIKMDVGGSVVATGGAEAAGIGIGGNDQKNFVINISGAGSIQATGGAATGGKSSDGAGIGSGDAIMGNILIEGTEGSRDLSITAVAGGDYGAGIGTGKTNDTTDSIFVSNATVDVTPGNFGAGIGTGHHAAVDIVSVTNCAVSITYGEKHYGAGLGAGADGTVNEIYLTNSDYEGDTIGSSSTSGSISSNRNDIKEIVIANCGRVIARGHSLYDASSKTSALTPTVGIGPGEGGDIESIRIYGCDYVEGTGSYGGAGIGTSGYTYGSDTASHMFTNNGGHCGELTISHCKTVVGTGSAGTNKNVLVPSPEPGEAGEKMYYATFAGAGIGAGTCGEIGTLSISGCQKVTATGGSDKGKGRGAAGIGGAGFAKGGDIAIENCSNVTATGGFSAAGIGSGGADPSLLERGEYVDNLWVLIKAAVIDTGSITLSGSTITSTGGDYGAGIGCGSASEMEKPFAISNCTITAQGGYHASGIGTSRGVNCDSGITISGTGAVKATGGSGGAGIGGGYAARLDGLSINMTTVISNSGDTFADRCASSCVIAAGGYDAAGIGSGFTDGSAKNILITGGYVRAQGGNGSGGAGAGIGTGAGNDHESLESLSITGGIVEAYGGHDNTDDIGCGEGNTAKESGSFSVTGGTVIAERWQSTPIIDGGSVSANFSDARNSGGQNVTQRAKALSAPFAQAKGEVTLPDYYGVVDLYADANTAIYPYLPASYHDDATIAFSENPSKTYDGEVIEDPSVATASDGAITYAYYSDAACTNEVSAPVDAGTWWVKAKMAATNSYAAAETEAMEFTIAPVDLALALSATQSGTSAAVTCTAGGFIGNEAAGSIAFSVGDKSITAEIDANGVASCTFDDVAAQDYTVTAAYVPASPANYQAASAEQTFAKDAQARTIVGNRTHTVKYGDGSFNLEMSASMPTANDVWSYEIISDNIRNLNSEFAATATVDATGTVSIDNAGIVQIRVTLSDTGNTYNPVSAIVTVVVERQAMTVTSYAYTNNPGSSVVSGTYGNLDGFHYGLHYSYNGIATFEPPAGAFSGTLSAWLPETTSAGPTHIGIRKEGTATVTYNGHTYNNVFFSRNYNIDYTVNPFTVNKAPLTIKAVDASGTYGEAEPTYAFTVDGMAAWDSLADCVGTQAKAALDTTAAGSAWGASLVPKLVGDTVVAYEGAITVEGCTAGSNYELTSSTPVKGSLTVNKGTAKLALSAPSITYNGKSYSDNNKLTFDKPDSAATYTVSYEAISRTDDAERATPLATAPTNAGAYRVNVAMSNSDRYEDITASAYFAISKVDGTIAIDGYNPSKTYDGATITPLSPGQVSATYSDNSAANVRSVWQKKAANGEWTVVGNDIAYAPADVGDYLVWAYVSGDENHHTIYANQPVSITPMTLTWLETPQSTYVVGSHANVALYCNGVLGDLAQILVDGTPLSSANYDLAQNPTGSTAVTLSQGYLDALSNGSHTILFSYANASAGNYTSDTIGTTLAVTGQGEDGGTDSAQGKGNPATSLMQTGDNRAATVILLVLAASSAVVLMVALRMTRHSKH